MTRFPNSFLLDLIRSCELHGLGEEESLWVISKSLPESISRSIYYNYKKKLYEDEKFHTLKKSIYKFKLLKCLLLHLDETSEPDGFNTPEHISEQFPDRDSIFHITKEQKEHIAFVNNKIQSAFCIPDVSKDSSCSNLTRLNELPQNYTLREEYVRCGKDKTKKCKSCPHGPYYHAY